MKVRCLIVDDEPLAHDVILEYAHELPFMEIIGQCYRATEAVEFISKHDVDLIFLDIRMPKLNGLDFLKTLKQQPLVIVISAFEEYALEGFELAVCDYLLKPFGFDRFLKAVNRALELYVSKKGVVVQEGSALLAERYETDHITIKSDRKNVLIGLSEIYYLESLGNYVKVWGSESYLLTPRTLSSFEQQLPSERFIRIHKSFIVNKGFVHYRQGKSIVLKNGFQLPVGKNYRQVI